MERVVAPIRKPKSTHPILLFKTEKEPSLQQEVEMGKKWSSLPNVLSFFFIIILQVNCFSLFLAWGNRHRETHQRPQSHTARKWQIQTQTCLFSKGQQIPDSSYPFLYQWQACLIDHCTDPGNLGPESTFWTNELSTSFQCCPELHRPASPGTPNFATLSMTSILLEMPPESSEKTHISSFICFGGETGGKGISPWKLVSALWNYRKPQPTTLRERPWEVGTGRYKLLTIRKPLEKHWL